MTRLPLNASFYEIRKNRTIKEATEENDTPRNIVIFNETCVMKGRRWSSPDGDSDWPVDWDEETFMDVYGEHFPDGDVNVVTVGEGVEESYSVEEQHLAEELHARDCHQDGMRESFGMTEEDDGTSREGE
jgi:hypothetical protein